MPRFSGSRRTSPAGYEPPPFEGKEREAARAAPRLDTHGPLFRRTDHGTDEQDDHRHRRQQRDRRSRSHAVCRRGRQPGAGRARAAELEILAASINRGGGRARVLAGDVRDEGYADVLAGLALQEFGALDGAFNNAGIVGQMGPVPEMAPENWRDVIAVNLTAA